MINSRKIEDLDLKVQPICEKHVQLCHDAGIELLITSTYRDYESQAALYAIGRTVFPNGNATVTNAEPGESWHNYKCAWDVVPLIMGKCVWTARDRVTHKLTPLWQKVVDFGKQAGAEAAADWVTFKEDAHFQVRPRVEGPFIEIAQAKVNFDKSGSIFIA